jgi:hypothetical protein
MWTGVKRVAFVPVHRSDAHPPDFPVPGDWPAEIMRRVFHDPSSGNSVDRSLRAYLHAASSGRADIDAVVLPMRVVDEQDVPPDRFEGELGGALRAQGFDAAALVMLGGPGAGTAQRGGFWARFVMAEGVGTWAMELMHCLTGFDDLYPFDGNLGLYDEMASNQASHPTAYTKAAVGWLDADRISRHSGLSRTYDLHTVGLVQPPPTGRSAAVRVGEQVPYLMVEGRERVDQFDQVIPSEGVIVYRVQTTDPLGHTQNQQAPVRLLTVDAAGKPFAVAPGSSFTTDTGVRVTVTADLPGGFRVVVEDPAGHLTDRSGEHGAPNATGRPTMIHLPGPDILNIAYRDGSGHLHELWRDANGSTGTTDLTANAGATSATGSPYAYTHPALNQEILLFRGADHRVRSLYWDFGPVGEDDLSGTAGSPDAAGDAKGEPVGYYVEAADTHHVVYASGNGHLHELWWTGVAPVGYGGDLTALAQAPASAGRPSAYDDGHGTNIVIYRSSDGVVRDLYWTTGAVAGESLSGTAGTPRAAFDPVAFHTVADDSHVVVYVDGDGHLWELSWYGVAPVSGRDLTAAAGSIRATGVPAAYHRSITGTRHVVYRSPDGSLHELTWEPGGPVNWLDLTAQYQLPQAAGDPAAVEVVDGSLFQHAAFRGVDGHVYEVAW